MTSYTKDIYYGLCSTTSDYEFFVDSSVPTTCPYHGGSITGTPVIANTNRTYSNKITNNYISEFKANSYAKVSAIHLKGIKDSVLREVTFVSKKNDNITSYDFRIYDITNNNTIVETTLSNDVDEITRITDDNINNQSYDNAIIEIQIKAVASTGKNRRVDVDEIEFIYEKL